MKQRKLLPLSKMSSGQSGTVAQLLGDSKLLKTMMEHGIRIGLKIKVNKTTDNENPIHINFGFTKVAVAPEAAKYILVNLEPEKASAEEDFSQWTVDPKSL